jgi:MFS family permease
VEADEMKGLTYDRVQRAGSKLTIATLVFLLGLVVWALAASLWPSRIRLFPLAALFAAWSVLQTAAISGLVWIWVSGEARKVHMSTRLRGIFWHAARALGVFFGLCLGMAFHEGIAWPGVVLGAGVASLLISGAYLLLKRKYVSRADTLFP